jgi:hypothetical protein
MKTLILYTTGAKTGTEGGENDQESAKNTPSAAQQAVRRLTWSPAI